MTINEILAQCNNFYIENYGINLPLDSKIQIVEALLRTSQASCVSGEPVRELIR